MEEMNKKLIDDIINIVRECGTIILNADRNKSSIDEKAGHANFVTSYDKKVQERLKEKLLAVLPEAVFVGEEEDVHASIEKGYAFIVDPIDGTTNFIKDYHTSAISVGLTKDSVQSVFRRNVLCAKGKRSVSKRQAHTCIGQSAKGRHSNIRYGAVL